MRNADEICSRPGSIPRRKFIHRTGTGLLAALALPTRATAARSGSSAGPPMVAFNTANLVARVSNYRYQLIDWMGQHKKTIAATDAAAWSGICREIADAGFEAVEVWEAHASPEDRNPFDSARRNLQWIGRHL
jgi:hypothetical protein